MSVMIFNASGGGRERLKLVNGTSLPTSAAQNTLWINTAASIGNLAVQPSQPTTIGGIALATGDVWVKTMGRGTLIVVHNGLAYAVAGVYMYDGGSWVLANAMYYNGAGWVIVNNPATALLLHGEANDTYTGIRDSSMYERPATITGGAAVSATQAKYGAGSIYVGGSTDYATFGNLAIGKGAFTVDAWVWLISLAANNRSILSIGGSGLTNAAGFALFVKANTGVMRASFGGSSAYEAVAALPLQEWHHVALTGNGGADGSRACKLFVDGTVVASGNVNYNLASNAITLGKNPADSTGGWYGYLDEVRVSTVERWTGAFTPPAYPYA